jgi:hypothetical protein
MKNTMKWLVVFLFGVSASSTFAAGAADFKEGAWFGGLKTGLVMVDFSGVDDIIPLTGLIGVGLTDSIAIEGELSFGLLGGEVDGTDEEVDFTSLGVFAAYRHPLNSTTYLKGKAGMVNVEVENEDDTDLAFGFGAGFDIGGNQIEIDYTFQEIEGTDTPYLGVAWVMHF